MGERNYSNIDPWDRDSYETGSTRPPKSHGTLIAVLLILVILLCGISSALGLLNIRLISRQTGSPNPEGPVVFQPVGTDSTLPPADTDPTQTSVPPAGSGGISLDPTPEPLDNIQQAGGLSLQEIYVEAIDSVVSISCITSGGTSSGTGVVLTENGYLVTNSHVVEGAQSIEVRFTDGRVLSAQVIGSDTVSDLAVLYVGASDLTPAKFGDSSSLRVGDAVAAIGDPLGVQFRGTMTDGIVSAINREVSVSGRTMTLIQTNAALNSGNSGGPLLNCYGQVIGINTMKISAFVDDAGVEGLGFAIPSTTVKEIVDQLISQGYVSGRPTLGLTGEDVPAAYQRFYRLPAGFYITEVAPGSSAAEEGIEEGDILIGLDGIRISSSDELSDALYAHQAGDCVEVVLYRNYAQLTVTLTLGAAS